MSKPDIQCRKPVNAYCGCGYCYLPGDLVNLEKDEVRPRQPRNNVAQENVADDEEEESD